MDPASLTVTDEITLPQTNNGTLELADDRLWWVDGQCCPSGDLATLDLATEQSAIYAKSPGWSSPTLEAVPGRPDLLLARDSVELSRLDISTTPPTPLPPEIVIGHGMAIPPGEGTVLGLDMREIDVDTLEQTGFKYEGATYTRPIAAGANGAVAGYNSYNDGEQVLIYGAPSPVPTLAFPVRGRPLDAEFDDAATKLFVASEESVDALHFEVLDLARQNLDLTLESSKTRSSITALRSP